MITLEPIGGLGNRMRAIDSVLSLDGSRASGVRVIWSRTSDCRCPFGAIFEPLAGATIVERGWWRNRVLRRVELRTGRYSTVIRQTDMERLRASGYDFRRLAAERSAFIQTFERFHPPHPRGLTAFRPVAALRAEINAVATGFTPATIGIHVRRGDHAPGRRSPTSAFIDRISQEIAHDPAVDFFLATDEPAVEAELRRRFGGRIRCYPKTFGRTTVPGIRAAIVELFALARTVRILGTFYSSFSETAAELGSIPLEIVTDPDAA